MKSTGFYAARRGLVCVSSGLVRVGCSRTALALALFSALMASSTVALAGPGTLAKVMPEGAIAFAEVTDLAPVIERIQKSSYLKMVLESPQFKQAKKSKQYRKADAVRVVVETQLGADLWTLSKKLLGQRVAAALYLTPGKEEPDVVAVTRAASPQALREIYGRIKPLLVLAEDGIDVSKSLDGTEVISFDDKAFVAIREDRVLVSSSRKLLDGAAELAKGKGKASLAGAENFKSMRKQMGSDHLLGVYVDTARINEIAGGRFAPRKLDEPMASLLFGGIVEMAVRSPYAGLTLDAKDGIVLTAGVASDPETLDAAHRPFFSEASGPGTPPIPRPEGAIGGLTIFRDFTGWYRNREHLLEARTLPGFDEFESGLGNLLPGKDFSEDVLPLIGSRLTFVSAAQDYSHLDGKPGAQLPGFALIVELAKPQEAADVLTLFFQTLSAILNIQAGQQGRQPWVMSSESHNGVQISYGRYLKKPSGDRLPFVFNFMPASARVGDRFIVSTSLGLCRGLVDELKKPASGGGRANRNFDFQLSVDPLADIIEANGEFFEAQAIQSGKTRKDAAKQLDAVLQIVRSFERVGLSTSVKPDGFQLELEVQPK